MVTLDRAAAEREGGDDEEAVELRVGLDGSGRRLDAYLTEQLLTRVPGLTRAEVQRWILEGRVTLGGRAGRSKDRLRQGHVIVALPSAPPLSDALPDPSVVLNVIYEDEELLVVDKPAGLVVHPAKGHPTGTLVNGLLARPDFVVPAADPRDPDGHLRPGIVHRIDKDTSGLLVIAKTASARECLKEQLSRHSMERTYHAIVLGLCESQTIESLHGRDPNSRLRFSTRVREGKRAVTHVERVKAWGQRATFVRCRLETGRTHQIRVHLSEVVGCPLFGDALYGGHRGDEVLVGFGKALGRQALHAQTLGFSHPDGRWLEFTSPLPPELLRLHDELDALIGHGA